MFYLILFILFTVISQVLLKKASLKNVELASGSYLVKMFKTPTVIFAYGLSLLNVFVWILALSQVSLLVAFFFTSSIYVIMVLVDHFLFEEKLNIFKLCGVGLITMGIVLLSLA